MYIISWSALILCLLHVCMVIVVNFRTNTLRTQRTFLAEFIYYIYHHNILYVYICTTYYILYIQPPQAQGAPCACGGCHRQQLAVVVFLPQSLAQTPLVPAVVSPIATGASGVFPSTHRHRYRTYTQATCTVWWYIYSAIYMCVCECVCISTHQLFAQCVYNDMWSHVTVCTWCIHNNIF